MGLRCALAGLMLVLLTATTGAAANGPPGPDTSNAARPSTVKSAPFSADVITQYDRALDNGGHIHRESPGKIFRDSQGRMRTESQSPTVPLGPEKYDHITINDPIQQIIIYLNPKNKTATIFHFGEVGPTALASEKQPKPKEKGRVRLGGQPGIHSGPTDPLGLQNAAGGPANPPSVQATSGTSSKMDAGNTSGTTSVRLGSRIIEGVIVTGTRTTRTINAGTIGNDKPIVSISDTWVSSDLKVTVLTETDDGQGGHSTMKLVNIVRGEPTAALFQIPGDYTVKENAVVASPK